MDGTEALAGDAVVTAVWDASEDDGEVLVAELDADVGAALGLKRSEATAPAVGDAKDTLVVPAAHCA